MTEIHKLEFECSGDSIVIDQEQKIDAAAGDGAAPKPKFMMTAYTGAAIRQSAFRYPVVVELSGISIPSQKRPIRFNHDSGSGVGHTERIAVEGNELIAEGLISRETEAAREVVASSKNGFPWQASIGATADEVVAVKAGDKVTANGRVFDGPLHLVRKSTLTEISFVDLGADDRTSASIAAKQEGTDSMSDDTTKDELVAGGDVTPKVDHKAAAIEATADLDVIFEKHSREQQRREAIAASSDRFMTAMPHAYRQIGEIAKRALEAGMSVKDFNYEVGIRITAGRTGMTAHDAEFTEVKDDIVAAALCMGARLPNLEESIDEKVLEAASKKWRHGLGLQEMLLTQARTNGCRELKITSANIRSVLEFVFPPKIQGSFSTVNTPGILSNVANKFVVDSFNAYESTWRLIARTRPVTDFKATAGYALSGDMTFEKVGPGGEIPHGTINETTYANRADTFAKMLGITRQDIINDDLGAFNNIGRRLGRGSALALNTAFWTEFLDDAAFFTSGNANLLTGGGSALGATGLSGARAAFRAQTDPDGNPLGVRPRVLLVPPELETTAEELLTSTNYNTGGSSSTDKVPNRNIWAGKYTLAVSEYLTAATKWYLLADPQDVAAMEVVFLNGVEMPTVESAEADFNALGIQVRGYFDFGVAKQEYRAGNKNAGS